jgi:hypothetical protein
MVYQARVVAVLVAQPAKVQVVAVVWVETQVVTQTINQVVLEQSAVLVERLRLLVEV